jgi:hypothetical protein
VTGSITNRVTDGDTLNHERRRQRHRRVNDIDLYSNAEVKGRRCSCCTARRAGVNWNLSSISRPGVIS